MRVFCVAKSISQPLLTARDGKLLADRAERQHYCIAGDFVMEQTADKSTSSLNQRDLEGTHAGLIKPLVSQMRTSAYGDESAKPPQTV